MQVKHSALAVLTLQEFDDVVAYMQKKARKKPRHLAMTGLENVAPRPGLEPGTYGLTVRRSTN